MTVVPALSGGWRTPDALLTREAAGQTLSERYSERMSVYDRQILLPTERSPSPVWSCLPIVILALVFFLVLGIGGVYAYRQAHQNRIYPGVTVLGLSVGRATRAEAEMALRAYVHNVRQQPLRVRVPDEVSPITLMALGVDAADEEILRLVDDAWWVGRDLPLGSWLMSQFRLLTRGYAVPGALTLDSEQAREVLQQLAEQLSREPVSATLRVTNSDAGFVSLIERSQSGRQLKVEETLLRLQRSLAGQLPSTLDLVLEELPVRVTEADLERPRAAVDHLLQSPLVLRAGDKTWSLEPDMLFSMLDTEALSTEQAAPVARLREDKVRAFVAGIAADANDPPGVPSLELDGSAIALQPGRAGAALDEAAAVRLVMWQALTEQRLLTLPIVTVQATLSQAALDLLLRQAGQRLTQPLVLRHASREWVLEGQALLDLVILQPIESATAPIAPATLPDLEVALDQAQVEAFIGAEVAAAVAVRVELARFELHNGRIEVGGGSSGLMPDSPATYAALATAFVSQDREARVAGLQVRPAHPAEIAVLLEPLRQQAEQLAARPVEVRYGTYTWPIAPADLAKMLRFRQSADGSEPYLDPGRLDTHVTAIAVEVRQRALGPQTADGRRRPVDVSRTAAAIRDAVQASVRVVPVTFVAAEDLPPPGPHPDLSAPWIPDR